LLKETIMERDREHDAEEDEGSSPSKADLLRAKLKVVAHYAMIGFAPFVSVVALVVGVIAMVNGTSQADRAKLQELTAKVDGLNASLLATKNDLEALKLNQTREKNLHAEERKKLDEQDAMIIQSVTHLQVKLKVSPTLEMQLREAASAPVAAAPSSAASAPVAAPALPAAAKKPAATAPESKSKPEASSQKASPQVKALRDAIEKFNKQ
jgi:outer membrane murein-binding lipoprotein Lpp